MTTDHEENESQESGSALRQKLEAALAKERAATKAAAEAVSKGFKFVKPEDLQDVEAHELSEKAAEIEQNRAAEQDRLLRQALADRGFADEDLDTAISKLKGGNEPASSDEGAAERVASLGSLGGTAPSKPEPQLFGEDRIRAAIYADDERKKARRA